MAITPPVQPVTRPPVMAKPARPSADFHFSPHPGHADAARIVAAHKADMKGHAGARHASGEAGKLHYRPVASD